MNLANHHRRLGPAAAIGLLTCCALVASCAQPASAQQGYGSYYGQKTVNPVGGMKAASPTNYLYDKYYYNRSTVSPYVNLDRLDTLDGTAYQSYVRPQQEARKQQRYNQAVYIQQRKLEGRVGDTRNPGAFNGGTPIMKPAMKAPQNSMGTYHNHWYGGWNK